MNRLRVLLTFGTRPEAIKMAPVVQECRRRSDCIETIVCVTGRHLAFQASRGVYCCEPAS